MFDGKCIHWTCIAYVVATIVRVRSIGRIVYMVNVLIDVCKTHSRRGARRGDVIQSIKNILIIQIAHQPVIYRAVKVIKVPEVFPLIPYRFVDAVGDYLAIAIHSEYGYVV